MVHSAVPVYMYKPAVDISSGTGLTESACSTAMVVVTKGGSMAPQEPPPRSATGECAHGCMSSLEVSIECSKRLKVCYHKTQC